MGSVELSGPVGETPSKFRGNHDISYARAASVAKLRGDIFLFPDIQMLDPPEGVVNRIPAGCILAEYRGRSAVNHFVRPFTLEAVVRAYAFFRADFGHAMVGKDYQVHLACKRQCGDAFAYASQQFVHFPDFPEGFPAPRALHMAGMVRFAEIQHHEMRPHGFRQPQPCERGIYACLIWENLVRHIPSVIARQLAADGIFRAHPIAGGGNHSLPLGGVPYRIPEVEIGLALYLAGHLIELLMLRIPESIVYQSVVVRDQPCGKGVVVGEGGSRERRRHHRAHPGLRHFVEIRSVCLLDIIVAETVHGHHENIPVAPLCKQYGAAQQESSKEEKSFHQNMYASPA